MFSRGFGDASILDTGRAGALTGAAEKAKLEMLLEAIVQFNAPFGCGFDQMDSAARRFRLEAQHAVGRALIQTEAAVDALVELGKVESRHSGVVGSGYFAVHRFQWRPFVSFEFRVSGFEVSTRNSELETRNAFKSTTPREFLPAPGETRRNSRASEIVSPD